MRRLSRIQIAQAAAIATLVHPVIATLGATYRWRVEGYEHYESLRSEGGPPILAFWHGRILTATYYFRRHGIQVMISENFDGEWIGRVIRKFGYEVARGSSSSGGRRALAQMRRSVLAGRTAGFAVDGPRGPARVAQPGAVWLASLTGRPVVPFHMEARHAWSLRSWDETQIPRPFSPVALTVGEPLHVPARADAEVLEACRLQLERSLEGLCDRAGRLLDGDGS